MISKISLWTQGIVIAVIIGTVLQMIVPNNKNKKYIKIVVGIYVLLSIIKPVVGNTFDLSQYNIEQYLLTNETSNSGQEIYNSTVNKMFNEKVKESIKEILKDCGYDSDDINIKTDEQYNIEMISISNISEYNNSRIEVNRVIIGESDKSSIEFVDKLKIKKKIAQMYDVAESQVDIK